MGECLGFDNYRLAEKIEFILARNVANTRARDFNDVYSLLKTRQQDIEGGELLVAITKKVEERNTLEYIEKHDKYIMDIDESPDLQMRQEIIARQDICVVG